MHSEQPEDLQKRIKLPSVYWKAPEAGYYPRSITEEGKAVWDRVLDQYASDFETRYNMYEWEHPKVEVLWEYAILTYKTVAEDKGVSPFTCAKEAPQGHPTPVPEPVLTQGEETEEIKRQKGESVQPEPTPEPDPTPEPEPTPDEDEDDWDDPEIKAALDSKLKATQKNIKTHAKQALAAVKIVDKGARLGKKTHLFSAQGSGGRVTFYDQPKEMFTLVIQREIENVDVEEFIEGNDQGKNWDDVVKYLKGKQWFAVGSEEGSEDLALSDKKVNGNVALSLQEGGLYLYTFYYVTQEEGMYLTGDDESVSNIKKKLLGVGMYLKENHVWPPLGGENLPAYKRTWS